MYILIKISSFLILFVSAVFATDNGLIGPAVTITDHDQEYEIVDAPLHVSSALYLESTDIKRSVILDSQAPDFQVKSLSSEKDVHVFEYIQASSLSLNDLVSGFLKNSCSHDMLFIIKSAECKFNEHKSLQLESIFIESRASQNYKKVMISDKENNTNFIAYWDEQTKKLTNWQEISYIEKDAAQDILLKEFWGVRSKKKSRI
jgi:hypothetical protein